MGNSMWRLATSINFLSEQVFNLTKEETVEIVVTDWGSETPISEVVQLTRKAATLTRFVHVPPNLAEKLQKDSPFGEVYALNVAARRSKGTYIGRIDQDTLVTHDFLKAFFDTHEGHSIPDFDLANSYMFAARKQLPYSFVKKNPSLGDLNLCIKLFGNWTFSEELKFCHWASPVGILIMHRDIWYDLGGYDERLIYYWFMDVDLGTRLIKKYPIVNIGKKFGYHFFHLEHIRPGFKFRHSHRKLNPDWSKSFDKPILNPNGEHWGLIKEDLPETKVSNEVFVEADLKVDIMSDGFYILSLFVKTIMISLRRWGYYKLKYGWYLSKRLRKKPYL